ncbi:MAG: hypothetical protein CME64_03255 [Halobacteriovoraceae bacterium]|nr:hypothetical protein [Halobacteriovoraceae bacterium]|tara:strand:- start:76882 stop:77178 length:297 start_codon:yes stop_codon:yes gene_type:complete
MRFLTLALLLIGLDALSFGSVFEIQEIASPAQECSSDCHIEKASDVDCCQFGQCHSYAILESRPIIQSNYEKECTNGFSDLHFKVSNMAFKIFRPPKA